MVMPGQAWQRKVWHGFRGNARSVMVGLGVVWFGRGFEVDCGVAWRGETRLGMTRVSW